MHVQAPRSSRVAKPRPTIIGYGCHEGERKDAKRLVRAVRSGGNDGRSVPAWPQISVRIIDVSVGTRQVLLVDLVSRNYDTDRPSSKWMSNSKRIRGGKRPPSKGLPEKLKRGGHGPDFIRLTGRATRPTGLVSMHCTKRGIAPFGAAHGAVKQNGAPPGCHNGRPGWSGQRPGGVDGTGVRRRFDVRIAASSARRGRRRRRSTTIKPAGVKGHSH
ncbi:hypothetical protein B7759_04475 [Burkholderia glumae]|nr:hypothetical protein KS03_5152 [Burkholderia glumae LMG 2196 = ATCC 33617]QKM57021.1 hypothetical protein CG017_05089 [Burkholderia glumae]QTP35841.1 hypothetical protein B7759_04475 [Burkholderia glumae]